MPYLLYGEATAHRPTRGHTVPSHPWVFRCAITPIALPRPLNPEHGLVGLGRDQVLSHVYTLQNRCKQCSPRLLQAAPSATSGVATLPGLSISVEAPGLVYWREVLRFRFGLGAQDLFRGFGFHMFSIEAQRRQEQKRGHTPDPAIATSTNGPHNTQHPPPNPPQATPEHKPRPQQPKQPRQQQQQETPRMEQRRGRLLG